MVEIAICCRSSSPEKVRYVDQLTWRSLVEKKGPIRSNWVYQTRPAECKISLLHSLMKFLKNFKLACVLRDCLTSTPKGISEILLMANYWTVVGSQWTVHCTQIYETAWEIEEMGVLGQTNFLHQCLVPKSLIWARYTRSKKSKGGQNS